MAERTTRSKGTHNPNEEKKLDLDPESQAAVQRIVADMFARLEKTVAEMAAQYGADPRYIRMFLMDSMYRQLDDKTKGK